MTTTRMLALAAGCALALLAACGGNNDGVKLGDFPALSATEGDAPLTLKAPTSASPASFSFDSSDPKVATVAGNKLTIAGVGTSTISARQGQMGSYNPTSTSALLTVSARVCAEPAVKENGVCVAPAMTASYVSHGGLTWMPATATALAWAAAESFCKTVKINGSTGWRLPTQFELTAMVGAGQLSGKEWNQADVWTSNAGAAEKTHVAVNLATNTLMSMADEKKVAVTCVL
jgi:hypothetical protein